MSDQSDPNYIDARDLYTLMLQNFPTTAKTPQAAMKDRNAFADQVFQMLGFNPLTYKPSETQQFTPKQSVVRLQYGRDPIISATLDDIDAGNETSSSVAQKLIDPDTGGLSEAAAKSGISVAQAMTAVDAAKKYEEEHANTIADQMLFEERQANDPEFGRTKSNAPNANLPEGGFGQEIPNFQYQQGLLDKVQQMSDTPNVVDAPPSQHNPAFTIPASQGGMTQFSTRTPEEAKRTRRPNISTPMPAHGPIDLDPRAVLPSFLGGDRGRKTTGPSERQRALDALTGAAKVVQKNAKPRETAANRAAVERLLQIQAALGG